MVSPFLLLLLLLFYVAVMSTLNSYQPAALGSCGSAYLPYSTNDTKAVWLSLYSLLSPSNTNVAWLPRLLFYHPMTHTHFDYPTTQRLCGSHTYSFITWWPSYPLWLPQNTNVVCLLHLHCYQPMAHIPTPIIQQHKRFVAPTPTPLSPDHPRPHSDYPTIQRSVWLSSTLFYHPTTPKFRDSHSPPIIQRHQCWVALISRQYQGWVAIVSSRIAQCRVTSISIALTPSNTMVVGLLLSSKSLIKSCCIVLYCIALCSVVKYSHHRTTAKLCTFRVVLFFYEKRNLKQEWLLVFWKKIQTYEKVQKNAVY